MARNVIETGLEAGQNPRAVALDIVGKFNRATGKREGGFIGLNSQQAGYVTNARNELRNLDAGYFDRTKRDKRFDGLVRRAIKDGKPLSVADVERITGRYSDRLLKLRGDNIARTEGITALRAGRHEGYAQLIESGKVAPDRVTVVWDSTGPDGRTRSDHLAMEGQTVKFGKPFIAPDGSQMHFPGDISLGASGDQTINCRCLAAYRIKRNGG